MKKLLSFRKGLFFSMVLVCGLFLCNCNKDESIIDKIIPDENTSITTRASSFHWKCPNPNCQFPLNGGWQNFCSVCGEPYSEPHGVLILTLIDQIKYTVGFNTTGPKDDNNFNRIELPNRKFPSYAPEPWYETPCAMKYYNELKNSSSYRLTPDYAEGIEFAWYRTVRSLYPKYHSPSKVELEYDKFIISEGRNLKGFKGQGIKDASKAAIKAFASCR